ncbi:hypothetical protein ACFRKE_01400 [Kitasatospora indigofera]|uniref:hypothetical protein n=1 Tax=Kitasatospora indigofera TaxID=67307 RepID=UPI0036AE448C
MEAAVRETREEASVVVHVGERIDVELHDGFTVFRAELLSVRRRPAAATRTSPRWAGCPWRVPAS